MKLLSINVFLLPLLCAAGQSKSGGSVWPGAWGPATATPQNAALGEKLLDQCGAAFKAHRYDEAFRFCQESMDAGNIDAREGLGVLYESAEQDYGKAVFYYAMNADIHPVAACSVAWLYWRGSPNFPVNYGKARFYFEKAERGGWREATPALGFMDELGQAAAPSRARALARFKIAGDRGNLWSQHIYEALNSPQAPRHFNSAEEIGVFVSDWLLERWRSIHQSDPLPPGSMVPVFVCPGGGISLGHPCIGPSRN
jgi:TPR repeat protein